MRQIIITLTLTFLFTGCSIMNSSQDAFKFKYLQSTSITDFHLFTKEVLDDLSTTILEIKSKRKNISPLYVTDFVNLKELKNKSQLGFILSDALKTNITQDLNWPIYQIEFSKYLKIGSSGTSLMSREVDELKYTNIDDDTYALVGTYSLTQRQLILSVKLVNLNNGVIIKSATKSMDLTDEIIRLEQKEERVQQVYQPITI